VITDPNRIPNAIVREFLAFIRQWQDRPGNRVREK